MNVFKQKHVEKAIFFVIAKALRCEVFLGIFKSSEQHVPNWEVAVIALMTITLVMNPVHLWTLEKVAKEVRGSDIGVVEHLTQRREHHIVDTRLNTDAQQHVGHRTAQYGVEDHFRRMLIERGEDFNPLRGVVNLVKQAPQGIVGVAEAMPPVSNEGIEKICDEPGNERTKACREVKQAMTLHPLVP